MGIEMKVHSNGMNPHIVYTVIVAICQRPCKQERDTKRDTKKKLVVLCHQPQT